MNSSDLRQKIEQQHTEELPFISWRSSAESETKIELVDYFLQQLIETVAVEQFELLDMEQMWALLLRLNEVKKCGTFSRRWHKKVEVIDWVTTKANGESTLRSCCFRCEGLLAIYEELLVK